MSVFSEPDFTPDEFESLSTAVLPDFFPEEPEPLPTAVVEPSDGLGSSAPVTVRIATLRRLRMKPFVEVPVKSGRNSGKQAPTIPRAHSTNGQITAGVSIHVMSKSPAVAKASTW